MCGIDIEPDTGTLTANLIKMDNLVITDVTRYGIVNQFRRCKDLKIANSIIENYISPSAKINNTHFIFDGSFECHVPECEITNSRVELRNQKQLVLWKNTKLSNTTIESTQGTYGNIMFEGDSCSMVNCTLKNLRGTGNTAGNIMNYGVMVHCGRIPKIENKDNTYENCTIYVLGELTLSQSTFRDCYVYFTSNNLLDKWNVMSGIIRTNSKLVINTCTISDTEMRLGSGIKVITDSKINGNFVNVTFPNGSECNNSTIVCENVVSNTMFNYVKFANASKLILEKNTEEYPIKNTKSILGKDYTIHLGE